MIAIVHYVLNTSTCTVITHVDVHTCCTYACMLYMNNYKLIVSMYMHNHIVCSDLELRYL